MDAKRKRAKYPKLKDRVEHILRVCKESRDNDYILLVEFIKQFYGLQSCEVVFSLETLLVSNMIPSSESITRARRLIQNEIPSLRGDNWEERRNNQGKYKRMNADSKLLISNPTLTHCQGSHVE